MGTGTTLRQIINMTTDSQIIDHPKRWKYMVSDVVWVLPVSISINVCTSIPGFFISGLGFGLVWTFDSMSASTSNELICVSP